jgi:hypothetical protein
MLLMLLKDVLWLFWLSTTTTLTISMWHASIAVITTHISPLAYGGARTHNIRFTKAVLYQLSYAGLSLQDYFIFQWLNPAFVTRVAIQIAVYKLNLTA